MTDKRFTLLELHFDGDVQLGPSSIGGPDAFGEEQSDDSDGSHPEAADRSEGIDAGPDLPVGGALKALAGLGVLAVVVGAIVRRLGGVPEPPDVDLDRDEVESTAD